jgi:hypothetical protein
VCDCLQGTASPLTCLQKTQIHPVDNQRISWRDAEVSCAVSAFLSELQIGLSSGTFRNVFTFLEQKAFKYSGSSEALSSILFFLWIQFTLRANLIEHVHAAFERVKLLHKGNFLSAIVLNCMERRNSELHRLFFIWMQNSGRWCCFMCRLGFLILRQ